MRFAVILALFISVSNTVSADDLVPQPRAKAKFSIVLTEGIVGGIVLPHVRQRVIVVSENGKHTLLVLKQQTLVPIEDRFEYAPATYHRGTLTDMQLEGLRKDIAKHGLWKLPTEIPLGCQDIYKLDTSIVIRDSDKSIILDGGKFVIRDRVKFWRNGGPSGCTDHGVSKVQPTEKQRSQFKNVVVVLKKVADQAKAPGDAKSFDAALHAIWFGK